jgi:hypothetical protein
MKYKNKYALCRICPDGTVKALMLSDSKKELEKSLKIITTPFDTCKFKIQAYSKSEEVFDG